jgi:hypothetical protein
VEVAHRHDEDYNHFVELLTHELNNLKQFETEAWDVSVGENVESETVDEVIYDPPIIRTKGFGPTSGTGKSKRNAQGAVYEGIIEEAAQH